MTDHLLQTVEEKIMSLLTELEVLRREVVRMKQENAALRAEQSGHAKRIQGLVSLLENVEVEDTQISLPVTELESFQHEEDIAVC